MTALSKVLNVEAAKLQPPGFPDGIYFDLHEDEYHADAAFSHSGIKDILVHEYDYWKNSPLNKLYPRKPKGKGMDFGSKCHMYLLQPELFRKTWRFPWEPFTGDSRKTLDVTDAENIKESIRLLAPLKESYFTLGYPEVSMFWTDPETGIRCRLRTDYLRTFGGIDYKRSNSLERDAMGWHIRRFAYDIQEAFYVEGIKQIKAALREGRAVVQGKVDPEWLTAFMNEEETLFLFVFQRSEPPFVFKPFEFTEGIRRNAEDGIWHAKKLYLRALANYGVENEWPAGDNKPEQLTEHHLPRRIFERVVLD